MILHKVCSYPQGLAQCKAFLEEHPSWKILKEVEKHRRSSQDGQ
ncbi:MAG: hypothetical protein ACLUI0_11925 [Blautia massiliensis (ex Durand et al. 2017)]